MTRSKGTFSLTLKALRLQLATLMDEAGGQQTIDLLDNLSEMQPEARDILLRVFNQAAEALSGKTDLKLKDISDFEEELLEGIISDFQALNSPGKTICENGEVIDLNAYRKFKN